VPIVGALLLVTAGDFISLIPVARVVLLFL